MRSRSTTVCCNNGEFNRNYLSVHVKNLWAIRCAI